MYYRVMNKITYEEKRYLEKNIKLLDSVEYNEILKILNKHKQKYSINKTGIFFNLKYIDNTTLKEMIDFVNFCEKNRKEFKLETKINHPKHIEEKNDIKLEKKTKVEHSKKTFEFKLDSESLKAQHDTFANKNNKETNFTFKNYLDKISIISNKEFENNAYTYPILNPPSDFGDVTHRIFKKCRNIDKPEIINNDDKILEMDII